jgi:hypothetical protein
LDHVAAAFFHRVVITITATVVTVASAATPAITNVSETNIAETVLAATRGGPSSHDWTGPLAISV